MCEWECRNEGVEDEYMEKDRIGEEAGDPRK